MKPGLLSWLRRKNLIRTRRDRYCSFDELSNHEAADNFHIESVDRGSPITIMAIHGGRIEPGTTWLAKALARDEFNLYCFNGKRRRNNWDLHITSTAFDEPQALKLAEKSQLVVTVHGCVGWKQIVYVGGDNRALGTCIVQSLRAKGLSSGEHPVFSGRGSANICNKGAQPGIQLELTTGFRISPFAIAARSSFLEILHEELKKGVSVGLTGSGNGWR
ncbi:MAG: replication protein [Rhodocyclaceae bacterium]|nr:MAG: replication protein [Rhodocyclaceae bacterium]